MSDVSIRIANAEDAELVAEISRETFRETFAPFNTQSDMDKFLSEQFTKDKLIDQVIQKGNIFLLAYINKEPAGYVFLKEGTHEKLSTNNAIEISRLYSRTAFIGKGVGKSLMLAAIAHGALVVPAVDVCDPGSPAKRQVASTPEYVMVHIPGGAVEVTQTGWAVPAVMHV